MKRVFGVWQGVILVALTACSVRAGTLENPQASGTTFAKDALQKFVDSGELPGAVSVLYKAGVQETCCIGFADVASKRPITLDSAFMQCSQTKGLCGVTVAKLVEEGKLKLDDPVSKYLPEFRELWISQKGTNGTRVLVKAKNALTVRMCMNHTGGLPFEMANVAQMGGWTRRMPLRSIAATAAAAPLLFEPGTRVQYSNVGIDIGATVVQVITGKPWEVYLKETVLDPLGMTATSFWPTDGQIAGKIELYDVRGGRPAKWRKFDPSLPMPYNGPCVFPAAGSGLWTTARDQLRFYKMLMNLGVGENGTRILSEETVKRLLVVSSRPQRLGGYSLGLNAPVRDGDDQWFGHGGAWGTNCSVNWHKKQLKLWVVQQTGGPRPWNRAFDAAANKFFGAKIDTRGIDAYTGRTN